MSLGKVWNQPVCITLFHIELGMTHSTDSASLACGVFEHFLGRGNERPKVLAATHFHTIFENGFLKERPELVFGFMEVLVNESADAVKDQVTYLYK